MIVSKKHYDYLRNKFDLLTNELVKANIDLSNNINFVSYMKPQDVQDNLWGEAEKIQYEDIVKALVKTIKFYEQADYKLDTDITQKVDNARHKLATNDVFKAWLNFYLHDYTIDINEATVLALVKTIWQLEEITREYKKETNELRNANLNQSYTIQERNNEINALKHMLDRKDEEQ